MYEARGDERCARVATDAWIVWNFQKDTQPRFENDVLHIAVGHEVSGLPKCLPHFLDEKNRQQFMQYDCLHYERCGIPCNHILRITNKIVDNMVKWKVYSTHFGDDSELGTKLMEAQSLQQNNESNGVLITTALLRHIMCPVIG